MKGIATHNSATGERAKWYSRFLAPFAKTQSKTIAEQYDAGCRLFDLRIKLWRDRWVFAHGGYILEVSVKKVMQYLNEKGDARVTLTYEGGTRYKREFEALARILKAKYRNIHYGPVVTKRGKNRLIAPANAGWLDKPIRNAYVVLDGRSWHSLIPFPWLWKKLCYNKPTFDENTYTFVDFL